MIKAVIFDFDGTIGDTLPLCMEAFHRAITPLSGKVLSNEEIVSTFGPSEEGTINAFLPDRPDEGLHAYWEWYERLHQTYPAPFAGVRELMDEMKAGDIIIGLVTGKAETSARISLGKYGMLDYFQAMEFGSPHGPRKVEGITAILNRFGLAPEQAAYVGDAPSDIADARRAGITMYSAAWAGTADYDALARLEPDQVFRTVEEFAVFVREEILATR